MRALALTLILVCGCTLQDTYVAADRATYEAVWPEYEEYFLSDPRLDKDQKERRKATGYAWKARVEEGEDQ